MLDDDLVTDPALMRRARKEAVTQCLSLACNAVWQLPLDERLLAEEKSEFVGGVLC